MTDSGLPVAFYRYGVIDLCGFVTVLYDMQIRLMSSIKHVLDM